MNANYIYDIFETTKQNEASDLNIGLAMLQEKKPIPAGMTDRGVREFMGRHYKALVKAYNTGDKALFAGIVAKCEAEDASAPKDEADQ